VALQGFSLFSVLARPLRRRLAGGTDPFYRGRLRSVDRDWGTITLDLPNNINPVRFGMAKGAQFWGPDQQPITQGYGGFRRGQDVWFKVDKTNRITDFRLYNPTVPPAPVVPRQAAVPPTQQQPGSESALPPVN
jgi:hypothetical protein